MTPNDTSAMSSPAISPPAMPSMPIGTRAGMLRCSCSADSSAPCGPYGPHAHCPTTRASPFEPLRSPGATRSPRCRGSRNSHSRSRANSPVLFRHIDAQREARGAPFRSGMTTLSDPSPGLRSRRGARGGRRVGAGPSPSPRGQVRRSGVSPLRPTALVPGSLGAGQRTVPTGFGRVPGGGPEVLCATIRIRPSLTSVFLGSDSGVEW